MINRLFTYNIQNKNPDTTINDDDSNDINRNKKPDEEVMPKFTFMTLEYKYFVCGKVGINCLSPDFPKSQWAIRLASNGFYQEQHESNMDASTLSSCMSTKTDNNLNRSKKKVGWANTHILMASCNEMKHEFNS